ncbi:hypothetical protein TTHERM_00500730 (macronuclear) [Tetrahymena thermophila SB210]|uniref:Uncharacterized protein n=1 Tax=Tetrahymena thermophila (strain SB210) TaxID=312017 RepID=I7M320_TETTS|nr:hypothetical protein TTHERM_00500730 [Tetrahymena thermophila SB210]EAS01987.1 hypothetical protein TTHERM_00500730 [Tetrahymena thermophila SB210]|eukprot:XP_001022232.1 hypothetical protein TTHERM_00500730 [Tetrahymena thermophila SB210]
MKITWFLGLLLIASAVTAQSLYPHDEEVQIINGEEHVQTPFGLMLRECVHNVPSGTYIQESEDGSIFLTNDEKNFAKRVQKSEKCQKANPSIKLEQWIDNGGWDLPAKTPLSKFEAYYYVPNTPQTTNNQWLYYFIGSQNNDGSGPGVSIIQPVLSYFKGWYFQSWNCCPDGQAFNSPSIFNITPHDQVYGSVQVKDSQVTIISQNKLGEQSTLTVDRNGRNFTWIDATLEIYGISNCTDYPKGRMTYSQMNVTLSDGTIALPEWDNTFGASECNGQTFIQGPKTISIYHNVIPE